MASCFAGGVPGMALSRNSLGDKYLRIYSAAPTRWKCPLERTLLFQDWTLWNFLRFAFFDQPHDLARFSVAMELRFLKNRNAVYYNLKASTPRRYQLDVRGGPVISELSRQTGGSRLIVSKRAVFDRDFHKLDVTHADSTRKNSISPRPLPFIRCRFQGRMRCRTDSGLRSSNLPWLLR